MAIYCTNCGKENSDDAGYCQKCGRAFEIEEETRVARRPDHADDGDEPPIFTITPTLKFVKAGYVLAIVAAFLLVAIVSILTSVSVWISVLLGLALLLIPAFYHLRQKLVRYSLTEATVEIDSGLVARTTQNIPLRRIQDVTVSSSITQRMLGLGDLVFDNASDDGTKIVLKNIDSPRRYADAILKQMRRIER